MMQFCFKRSGSAKRVDPTSHTSLDNEPSEKETQTMPSYPAVVLTNEKGATLQANPQLPDYPPAPGPDEGE